MRCTKKSLISSGEGGGIPESNNARAKRSAERGAHADPEETLYSALINQSERFAVITRAFFSFFRKCMLTR